MTNPYFNYTGDFIPGTTVQSGGFDALFAQIGAAFDNFPENATSLKQGTAALATESGSGNAYVVSFAGSSVRTANADADEVVFRATHTNTGPATLQVDAIAAVSLVGAAGAALASGDIVDGFLYIARFDNANTRFVLINPQTSYINQLDTIRGYAQEWATQPEDTIVSAAAGGGPGQFSSLHYAAKTEAFATAAEASAVDAANSAASIDVNDTLFYAGDHDASTGAPTTPTVGGRLPIYRVTTGGTIGAITFAPEDLMYFDEPAGVWRKIGSSVFDAAAITTGEFDNGRISEASVTQHQAALTFATTQITSGTLADARVAQSNVTQHQGALAVSTSQVTSGTFASARISAASVTQHQGSINHDALSNFVAAEHVDHSTVQVVAGTGMTGGGAINTTRTLNVVGANGITANANDIRLSGSYSGTFTATDIQASSDERLKRDITTIDNPMGILRSIRGTHYYREDLKRDQYGVIAQEVMKVMPEAVTEYGEDGHFGVAYGQITAVLVEAVRRLDERTEALEAEI